MNIFKKRNSIDKFGRVTPFDIRKTVSTESVSDQSPKDGQGRPKHSPDEMRSVKAKLRDVDHKLAPSTDFRESTGFGRSMMVNLAPEGRQQLFDIFHLEAADAASTSGISRDKLHFVHTREVELTPPPAYTKRPRRNDIRVTKVTETRGLPTFDGHGDTFVYWVVETPDKVPGK